MDWWRSVRFGKMFLRQVVKSGAGDEKAVAYRCPSWTRQEQVKEPVGRIYSWRQ